MVGRSFHDHHSAAAPSPGTEGGTVNRIPSIRVTDAADAAVLGLWHRSDRVSRRHGWRSIVGGPLLLILGIVPVIAAFAVPGPRWLVLPLLGLPALYLLSAGGLRTYAELFRLRIGPLIMHRFDEGFVAERPRGPLRAVAFAELKDARLIDHHGADGAMVLLLMVHWDGTAWACLAPSPAEALVEMGHAAEARREKLPRYEVNELLRKTPPWTGWKQTW